MVDLYLTVTVISCLVVCVMLQLLMRLQYSSPFLCPSLRYFLHSMLPVLIFNLGSEAQDMQKGFQDSGLQLHMCLSCRWSMGQGTSASSTKSALTAVLKKEPIFTIAHISLQERHPYYQPFQHSTFDSPGEPGRRYNSWLEWKHTMCDF